MFHRGHRHQPLLQQLPENRKTCRVQICLLYSVGALLLKLQAKLM